MPMAALSAVEGRVLAGPMRAGEVVSDLRLVGPALLEGYTSTPGVTVLATPVRIADAGAVRPARPGDRIDVLAAGVPSEPRCCWPHRTRSRWLRRMFRW